MAIKYVVIPGEMCSRNDGDLHYITAPELIRLYGVDPAECVIYSAPKMMVGPGREDHRYDGLIPLLPRYDGFYRPSDSVPLTNDEFKVRIGEILHACEPQEAAYIEHLFPSVGT